MKAFPDRYYTRLGDHVIHEGMDLRDYFAAKAMQAIITNEKTENMHPDAHSVAQDAYVLANAMMEARK
jgi:hypothetical protein